MSRTAKAKPAPFANLDAFRPDDTRKCEVCDASPVVNATGLCGPCTWGEADTIGGAWWDREDEERWARLKKAADEEATRARGG